MPPGEPTDEQLLVAYRQGDRDSFARLVERYQRELYHFLARFLGDHSAAEDIFQESFLQVHQSAERFDSEQRFRPWLFTIAANKARDLLRAQSRRPTTPLQTPIKRGDDQGGGFIDLVKSAEELPDQAMIHEETAQHVRRAVMGLPPNLREILILSYFHQFPYKQIGEMLDIPLGTVKSRLHTAVTYFARHWKDLNPDRSAS